MANPNFIPKEDDSVQTLVKLRGNPLNYIISLKARYMQATGKELGKGQAIQLLLNKVSKEAIEQALKEIIEEAKLYKKT